MITNDDIQGAENNLKDVLDNYKVNEWKTYSMNPYTSSDSEGILKFVLGVVGDDIPDLRIHQYIRDELNIPFIDKRVQKVVDEEETKKARMRNKYAKAIMTDKFYLVNNIFSHGNYRADNGTLEDLLIKKSVRTDIIIILKYDNKTNEIENLSTVKSPREGLTSQFYSLLRQNLEQYS